MISSSEVWWAEKPNTYELWVGTAAPSPHTSASVLVMSDEGLVCIEVLKRGWDIPGGHIEDGEGAIEAALREVQEEAGLTLAPDELTLYGWAHLELHAPKPAQYRYPYPHTYQPVFVAYAGADRLHSLATEVPDEVGAVRVVSWDELPTLFAHHAVWPLIEAAVQDYRRSL